MAWAKRGAQGRAVMWAFPTKVIKWIIRQYPMETVKELGYQIIQASWHEDYCKILAFLQFKVVNWW
jgi:hypothetical protein